MTDKIRLGIIGAGKHGSRYARHIINDLDKYELTAISRRSEDGITQAENWNCKYFAHWHDLIARAEVDAVISAVPPCLNLAVARACCTHGKHLLIEKPLAPDADEAGEIVRLFKKHNLRLTVGHTLRYKPIILELKKRLPELGRLYAINAQQRLEPSIMPWLADRKQAGGGVILHTAVHIFDALRFISGLEFKKIRAMARQIHNPQVEDLFSAQFEMEDNISGTISASKVGQGRCGSYEFICDRGQLHGDQVHGMVEIINNLGLEEMDIPPSQTIVPLLKDWYNFLTGHGNNPIAGQDGLMAVKICHACYHSIATGEWACI